MAKNGNRYLEQVDVTRFAKTVALLKKLTTRKDRLRKQLLVQLENGYRCPRGGPYLVTVLREERRDMSWEEQWYVLAERELGKKKAERLHDKLLDDCPTKPVVKLKSEVNPDYRTVDK